VVVHKFSSFLVKITNAFVVFLLCVMSADILLGVFYRYALVKPLPWAEDLGRYLMVWIALFGVGIVMHHKGHVAVTICVDHLTPRARGMLLLFSKILVLAFGFFMGYLGIRLLIEMLPQISPTLRISMWWVYFGFPFYGFFLTVSTLDQIVEGVRQLRS
jgi:TRAP-type C4-dicarboxylate transport system permease small subunit